MEKTSLPDYSCKNLITEYITASYYPCRTGNSDLFLQYFLTKFSGVKCIFMYGSMLNSQLSTPTSFPDFYVVVDDYAKFYKSYVHASLNKILPPNSYFLKINNNGASMPSKYCVISACDLDRTTDYKTAKDFFIAGRLAKHIGILYVKDESSLYSLINNIYNAMRFNVMFTLSEMDSAPYTFDEFIVKLLGLSYRSEIRTETESKIISIYKSERSFYEKLYKMFLEQEVSNHTVEKTEHGYKTIKPYFSEDYRNKFIKKSRRRAVYRWPKGIYTFSNYIEYLELKVERTTGEKVNLSKWDRRFPLIFGWRHVFRLLKKKVIR